MVISWDEFMGMSRLSISINQTDHAMPGPGYQGCTKKELYDALLFEGDVGSLGSP